MPDSARRPPGCTSAMICGARATSGPARIFATTTSAGSRGRASGRYSGRRSASMPLRPALSREASSACGSMSVPTARPAPSSKAAMARMPEPQPKSSTLRPARSSPSSHSRHSAVVGWVPVPKARPGSSSRLTASGSGAACQLGTIHRRRPKRIGWKLSIQLRSQSWSSMRSKWCSGSAPPVSSISRPSSSASSVSASNSASRWVCFHSGVVPRSGSKIGWASASMKGTETAPASSSASS